MYFIGVIAQVGTFATVAFLLWWMLEIDVIELLCISSMISMTVSLPILIQIERWVNGSE